jgi:ABC-type branched-subunit amino acid transport system substrate-binding protein
MTKLIANIFAFFFISIVCYSTSFAESPTAFKFGVSAPLSGILAEYGTAVRNGIDLASKDRPENFDKIELIYEDSQWDPKTAIAAFNVLKNAKGAQLIFNWGNPTSEAVAPLAERYQYPLLVMSLDPSVALKREYVIRSLRSGNELGELLGAHISAKGYKKVGVLLAENSYVQGLYEGLQKSLSKTSTKLDLLAQVNMSEQDFKSSVSRLKQNGYDAVAVFLITGQVRSYFQQAESLGLKLPAFGADFFGSQTEIEASGVGIEGAVFPDLSVTKEFRNRYLQTYGNDIQISFAANAYDVATQVALLFSDSAASKLKPKEIIERLRTSPVLNGAHGSFAYENDKIYGPAFVSDIVLRQVRKKEIVNIQ